MKIEIRSREKKELLPNRMGYTVSENEEVKCSLPERRHMIKNLKGRVVKRASSFRHLPQLVNLSTSIS